MAGAAPAATPSRNTADANGQATAPTTPPGTKHLRARVFKRDGHACVDYGGEDLTLDYLVSPDNGGAMDEQIRNAAAFIRSGQAGGIEP